MILDFILVETLNGLTTHTGHEAAVDFLDRIEENARFHVESLTADTFATAIALFRQRLPFSFADVTLVPYMNSEILGYLCVFNDGFDAAEDIYPLGTPTNPSDP